jgi:hypothetical protein
LFGASIGPRHASAKLRIFGVKYRA